MSDTMLSKLLDFISVRIVPIAPYCYQYRIIETFGDNRLVGYWDMEDMLCERIPTNPCEFSASDTTRRRQAVLDALIISKRLEGRP